MLFGSTIHDAYQSNAVPLCTSSTVADGLHEVNVSVNTSASVFYLDWVYYTPSPTVSLATSVIRIDATDPSLVFLGTGWMHSENFWPLTQVEGDQVSFSFYGEHAWPA